MPRIRWAMILMCFLANVINFIDRANLAIAAPSIRADLGLDAVGMGLVLSAFFWTYAFLQLPAGWFIDKVGVRVSLALAAGDRLVAVRARNGAAHEHVVVLADAGERS